MYVFLNSCCFGRNLHSNDKLLYLTVQWACYYMNIDIQTDLLQSFELQCSGELACYDLTLSIEDLNYGNSAMAATAQILCGYVERWNKGK